MFIVNFSVQNYRRQKKLKKTSWRWGRKRVKRKDFLFLFFLLSSVDGPKRKEPLFIFQVFNLFFFRVDVVFFFQSPFLFFLTSVFFFICLHDLTSRRQWNRKNEREPGKQNFGNFICNLCLNTVVKNFFCRRKKWLFNSYLCTFNAV